MDKGGGQVIMMRVPSRAVMQRLWLQPPHGGDDLCQLEKRGQGWDMVFGVFQIKRERICQPISEARTKSAAAQAEISSSATRLRVSAARNVERCGSLSWSPILCRSIL